jgi:hypothetical protein
MVPVYVQIMNIEVDSACATNHDNTTKDLGWSRAQLSCEFLEVCSIKYKGGPIIRGEVQPTALLAVVAEASPPNLNMRQ